MLRYLPFTKGIYTTAPGLSQMAKAESASDRLVFQIDGQYQQYIENKVQSRLEDFEKYVCQDRLPAATAIAVNKFLSRQLAADQPDIFVLRSNGDGNELINKLTNESITWQNDWLESGNPAYRSLFDALCCQVQEDVVICQLSAESDWLAALHLCAPNHWAAADKLGKPFSQVHAIVPGMDKMMPHYRMMLESIVHKGPFTRFAWGIGTDNRLNHHPTPPPGIEQSDWQGREFEDASAVYIRVERQNLIGLPQENAFIFTIRTYFYTGASLQNREKKLLLAAIASMSTETLKYKGLWGKTDRLEQLLFDA